MTSCASSESASGAYLCNMWLFMTNPLSVQHLNLRASSNCSKQSITFLTVWDLSAALNASLWRTAKVKELLRCRHHTFPPPGHYMEVLIRYQQLDYSVQECNQSSSRTLVVPGPNVPVVHLINYLIPINQWSGWWSVAIRTGQPSMYPLNFFTAYTRANASLSVVK